MRRFAGGAAVARNPARVDTVNYAKHRSIPMKFAPGSAVPRTEDPRFLKGGGRYSDDIQLPHQTHMVIVRSDYPHARLAEIDISAALDMPGVLTVLTGADWAADGLGDINGPGLLLPFTPTRRDGQPMYKPPRPALPIDTVRFLGQPIAIVVAESHALALDASEAVMVEYEPLDANTDPMLAREPDTALIWPDCDNNECLVYEAGDAQATEAAIAGAPHVVRERLTINRVHASPLEPRAIVARYDQIADHLTIWGGCQRPFAFRELIANAILKIDEGSLSLIAGDLGGSFGLKGSIPVEMPLVGWASMRTGRPVRWCATRQETMIGDDHGRDQVFDVELALDDDGRILAARARGVANIGAFMGYFGAAPAVHNVGGMAGTYVIPTMHVDVAGVFTNTQPIAPYRGSGRPEATYLIERIIDIAAARLGFDRIELRRRNMIPDDGFPYKTALTFTYDCGEFGAVFEKALEAAEYRNFEARRAEASNRNRLRGMGVAMSIELATAPSAETCELRFNASGKVTVLAGSTNHGQGHETIYTQALVELLRLAPGDIRVVEGDTEQIPYGTGSGGSRTAAIGTQAVLEAAKLCIEKGRLIAAHLMQTEPENLEFMEGQYRVGDTGRSIPFRDVAQTAFKPAMLPAEVEPGLCEIGVFRCTAPSFPNACQVCEVEIDPDTGEITIIGHWAVDDVGFEINPLLVKGQIHGGIAQSTGQALMENIVFDEDSQLLTASFLDYAMPRASDLCNINVQSHPVPTATNPLGVKGVGEAGAVGALPVVVNAVINALQPLGIDHVEMPLTPARIWNAIRSAGTIIAK